MSNLSSMRSNGYDVVLCATKNIVDIIPKIASAAVDVTSTGSPNWASPLRELRKYFCVQH